MATPEFKYQKPFPMGDDTTEYYLLTKEYVSVDKFGDHDVLKVEPEALRLLARTAFHDIAFYLRHIIHTKPVLCLGSIRAIGTALFLSVLRSLARTA